MKPAIVLAAVLVVAGTTACAQPAGDFGTSALATEAAPTDSSMIGSARPVLIPDGYSGRYEVGALVLEDQSHGPQLCFKATASLIPHCTGTELIGWSWQKVEHESRDGSRWGHYRIIGTYDGTRITVIEASRRVPATPARLAPRKLGDLTPCPPPPGGWQPVDPAEATEKTFEAARALAESSSGYAGLWIDQETQVSDADMNDPRHFILNVAFTHDLAERAAKLRQVWGGALCVTPARYSEQQLRRIQAELTKQGSTPDVGRGTGIEIFTNTLRHEVLVAFESEQKAADEKYGPGAVTMISRLRPIDPVAAPTN